MAPERNAGNKGREGEGEGNGERNGEVFSVFQTLFLTAHRARMRLDGATLAGLSQAMDSSRAVGQLGDA